MSNNKTHCLNGHEFTPENTYDWYGHRHCRKCRAERQRPVNEAKKLPPLVTVRPPEGMKYCSECNRVKDIDQFPLDVNRRDGRFTYCKPCSSALSAASEAKHWTTPEGRTFARQRNRARKLKTFGLTLADYQQLLEDQHGVCAICNQPETAAPAMKYDDTTRPLAIDHDHTTGKVRGLLCHRCNVVLGLADDDPDRLETAARYLRSG